MALAWVLRDSRITSVIIGASKIEQIDQNISAIKNLEFTESEIRQIDAVLPGEVRK
jgi:L-glyceraldehyde 3-phosphate reductase